MADFRRLVAASLLAGILAGLLLSILQHYQTLPLILAAERFETPDPGHVHDWQPEDGWQRNLLTVLFNGLTGFGFALLLTGAMYWRGDGGYQRGLAWGVGGYLVFFAAPSLGLPPELPGTDSAALHSRQAWWLFTAVATGIGLSGLFLSQNRLLQIAGAILLIVPHLIGAPHPAVIHASAPEALQHSFVLMSSISNGLFWLTLGGLSGWLLPKFTL
ncbi:MAG: CbtA family protein [Methylococcaceae bacterium]|nr:CbtA family protein [Methylococcaceae bacterium]